MADLSPEQLALVRRVLALHLPGAKAFLFGSRTRGSAQTYSDLDVAVDAGAPVDLLRLAALEEAFQESDLPFRIDLTDWHRLSPEFREQIRLSNPVRL
jgi:uncharacterized protein